MLANAALPDLIRQNNTTRGNVFFTYINSNVQNINCLNQHPRVYKDESKVGSVSINLRFLAKGQSRLALLLRIWRQCATLLVAKFYG